MTRNELKEVISAVITRLEQDSPESACGVLWSDRPVVTTEYAIGEEDPITTRYAIGEEDPTTLYSVGEEG